MSENYVETRMLVAPADGSLRYRRNNLFHTGSKLAKHSREFIGQWHFSRR